MSVACCPLFVTVAEDATVQQRRNHCTKNGQWNTDNWHWQLFPGKVAQSRRSFYNKR